MKRPIPNPGFTRRFFLGLLGAGAVGAASSPAPVEAQEGPASTRLKPGAWRHASALNLRIEAARRAFRRGYPSEHPDNGDESLYPNRVGNYSKALPHNRVGEVDPAAYAALLKALASGGPEDFERIPMGDTIRLTDPQAGLARELEGPDSHDLLMPPAPALASTEAAGELVELYWMALARDVPFADFETDPLIAEAAAGISVLGDFRGPKQSGVVTPAVIFRGSTPGDLVGPFLSQFLLKDFSLGALPMAQRIRSVLPAQDFLTDFDTWLSVQNGRPAPGDLVFDGSPRYLRSLRDLAEWVRVDVLFQGGLHACLSLLGMGVPFKQGIPYISSRTQDGFGSFGGPHIQSLVGEIAARALRAVWFQKWFVHRRLRPEELAGRLQAHLDQGAACPVHPDLFQSTAVSRVQSRFGSALLPQAYPGGCPTHPSYGAGHATVAGATVSLLKAWFDENSVIPDPVVPNAEGSALLPYSGPDADRLTVGNELNKLAANVALGRNAAGIHYRSDYLHSLRLGEQVAIAILEEQKLGFNEPHSYTFTAFDGTTILI